MIVLSDGFAKAVRNMILELLSPISTVHPTYFLAGVAVAWAEQAELPDGRRMSDRISLFICSFNASSVYIQLKDKRNTKFD